MAGLEWILDESGFPPRWRCGSWSSELGWTHITSDVLTFLAYVSIPAILLVFVRKKKGLPFPPIFWMFSIFILSCGFVHLIEATIFWEPLYRLSAVAKVITAVASVATVVGLLQAMPQALLLRGPETAAKQAQRETAERYEFLLREAAHIIWVADERSQMLREGSTWAEFTGQATETIGFASWIDLVHPADQALVSERWQHALTTGATFNCQYRVRRADGAWRWVLSHAVPSHRTTDGAVRWIGMKIDVTRHKRAEQIAETVFELCPTGLLVCNELGEIETINRAARRMLVSSDELGINDVDLSRFVPEFPRIRRESPTPSGIAGRNSAVAAERITTTVTRKNGDSFPAEIAWTAVPDDFEERTIVTLIDMTEQQRAEQALLDSLREKEVLIREIHHRVKNNLTTIGSLLALQARVVDPKVSSVLNDCRDRVHSMALVHEKLYRTGNFEYIDIAEYLWKLARYLKRSSSAAGLQILVDRGQEPLIVAVDHAIPIGLIYTELMSNAIKHAYPIKIDGVIRTEFTSQGTRGVVTISDDGIGMQQPQTKSDHSPHGMGLMLVDALVQQIDGSIRFESSNQGTQVRLEFALGEGR